MPKAATQFKGITKQARMCGVSHTHLRLVLKGERKPSARLQAQLEKLGIVKAEVSNASA